MSHKGPQKGEIVWAKVEGWDWWPAQVAVLHPASKDEPAGATVNFVGTNNHAELPLNKLAEYDFNYPVLAYKPTINLCYSIMSANKLAAGKSTFEGTFCFLDLKQTHGQMNKRNGRLTQMSN